MVVLLGNLINVVMRKSSMVDKGFNQYPLIIKVYVYALNAWTKLDGMDAEPAPCGILLKKYFLALLVIQGIIMNSAVKYYSSGKLK